VIWLKTKGWVLFCVGFVLGCLLVLFVCILVKDQRLGAQ
jgi:hypothetical protein